MRQPIRFKPDLTERELAEIYTHTGERAGFRPAQRPLGPPA
ncbi:hypothetical protein [Cupriavidus necator]